MTKRERNPDEDHAMAEEELGILRKYESDLIYKHAA